MGCGRQMECSFSTLTANNGAHATVNGQPLAGNVFAGIAGIQKREALQVFIVTQAQKRRMAGHVLCTQFFEQAVSHFAGKKSLGKWR